MPKRPSRRALGGHFSEAARLLWAAMDDRAVSQRALAELLGVNHALLNRWLYGDQKPGLPWALVVQARLGIDPALWGAGATRRFVPPGGRARRAA